MRIPVFRTRAVATGEAPGRRIQARMRGDVLARAELQKGEVGAELISQVGEYAKMRYEASQEAQYNEAALAIEEGMQELEYTLSKSTDIYNVLDGENNWQSGMDELRNATVSSLKNRGLQQKLGYAFDQNEITARFRLRGIIDKKIFAREQAAIAARMEKKRIKLSQVGSTIEDYNTELGIVANDQTNGVAGGRYNLENVTKSNYKLRTDIAVDYLANAFSNDPNAAMQLFNLMSLQDEVAAGTISTEDAMSRAGITDSYALHVLYNIERGDAVEIIQKNLATSLKFFDAQEKLETEQQEETNQRNTKAYNFFFSVQDSDIVEPEQLKQLLPSYEFEQLTDVSKTQGMTGSRVKNLLQDVLNKQFWATREQQARMQEELDQTTQFKFAPAGQGSEARYSELYALAERGMLTVSELNTDTFRITAQQHRELNMKIFNEADESLKVGSRLLKRAFKYNELDAQTDNPTLARASKSAFENADFALQDEFSRREAEGNPMTLAEIRAFAKEQIEVFGESYRDELRLELEDYFINQVQQAFPAIELNLADPLGAIDRWYGSLPAPEQDRVRSRKTTFRRIIKSRFGNQGLGF